MIQHSAVVNSPTGTVATASGTITGTAPLDITPEEREYHELNTGGLSFFTRELDPKPEKAVK